MRSSHSTRFKMKRDHPPCWRPSPVRIANTGDTARSSGTRSTFARLLLFKKIHYVQLLCSVAVFFSFLFFIQMFLPAFVIDDARKLPIDNGDYANFSPLKDLDFGDDIRFEPLSVEAKFRNNPKEQYQSVGSRNLTRIGYRKPVLALVFGDLLADPYQIQIVTVATALREIGYEIEVFTLEDGPVRATWTDYGFPLHVITADKSMKFNVDWLNYNGVLVNSLKSVGVLYSLMQEPFKSVPLVWNIHEQVLAERMREHVSKNQDEQVENWKKVFSRATAVVFPNYFLPMAYSPCDPGNYVVIPGSPVEAWKADKLIASQKDNSWLKVNYGPDDFVVAIVGSQLLYRGQWLEHALVLQALHPVLQDFSSSDSHLEIVILAGDNTGNYSHVIETIALKLKYPNETVKCVAVGEDADTALSDADLVIYGSFLDEPIFPDILLKAMCLGKPVIAPDLPMIVKYVSDNVTGYIFPKENIGALTQIIFQLVSNGKLSISASSVASLGAYTTKNLMVSENVEGYASLLENILMLPSEVALSQTPKQIPSELTDEWQWHRFRATTDDADSPNTIGRIHTILDKVEKQFNHTHKEYSMALVDINDTFVYTIWEDQNYVDMVDLKKKREDEELKGRTDQPVGIWDDIYKSARRPPRKLHERDDGELERTGQPLCIYEPYFGEGTWPFLHHTSLYRGIGLSMRGRRPGADDIGAPSRLPLLNSSYYRDALGEYGAFFAIANRIDDIHKNSWIGFQSWRATARKRSLSKTAERSLLDAIEARRHGDALYFWARLNGDMRNQLKRDFWSYCDAVNAGNCRYAFLESLKKMYDIKRDLSSLPPMPLDGGAWSVMHTWTLPTKSFLEFIMFSRMFVDALDAQFYDVHQKTGHCCLSLHKDKQCYSRLLELLINVWAYHSARKMVYMDPRTGLMQEQHEIKSRKGIMWIQWFQLSTLKSMDEDLAEEYDLDEPKERWLWPSTGEIFWKGIYEKEREEKNKEKETRKKKNRDRIERMKERARKKAAKPRNNLTIVL